MLDDFIQLSLVLTGERRLNQLVAEQYLKRIENGPLGSNLSNLLQVFHEIQASGGDVVEEVGKRIIADASLGPLAKQITILWFTAQIFDDQGHGKFETAEQYFSALVWSAIGAHPLGLSGGYFGHWRYPPEN